MDPRRVPDRYGNSGDRCFVDSIGESEMGYTKYTKKTVPGWGICCAECGSTISLAS